MNITGEENEDRSSVVSVKSQSTTGPSVLVPELILGQWGEIQRRCWGW